MKVDPITTAISDLTDAEATDLRDLCERMINGPVPLDHPLFSQWVAECFPHRSRVAPPTLFTVAFLPRALHALLAHTTALLRELEFAGSDTDGCCPWCGADKGEHELHSPGCRLAVAIGARMAPERQPVPSACIQSAVG